ncbi:hypothetical protein FACS1894190_09120 [Spirochaetia bacterium]|nr:hypothetical protein FACS1894190_09120 [Spirochaetia bacterium]
MNQVDEKLMSMGVVIPEIILPAKNVDIRKWAVIACDQWTQDAAYWEQVEKIVGDSPSTLNMIYPEIYLNAPDKADRVQRIHETMDRYLKNTYSKEAILCPPRRAGVFIERECLHGTRYGLIIAVDLECYDWHNSAKGLIRTTEGTIRERIPPRLEIRRGAALELPHILLLINDEENILMTLLKNVLHGAPDAYNAQLMMDGGKVSARLLYRRNDWAFIADAFEYLLRKSRTTLDSEQGMIFAVGDGNHSLATAKAAWEEYKAAHGGDSCLDHPCRYAMVEVVNLYDPALDFEPIHRIVFNADQDLVLKAMQELPGFECSTLISKNELVRLVAQDNNEKNRVGLFCGGKFTLAQFDNTKISVEFLEPILDKLANSSKTTGGDAISIDYIHGIEELFRLSGAEGSRNTGILMPPFKKNQLFTAISKNGALPRKTFSMGEPSEKRFYLECRKIS